MFLRALLATFLTSIVLIPSVSAEQSNKAMEISRCEVYVDGKTHQSQDCRKEASQECANKSLCELPIGRNLTGGKMLADWAKVIVEYRCGSATRINGPHHQNDHATMTLACGGRG